MSATRSSTNSSNRMIPVESTESENREIAALASQETQGKSKSLLEGNGFKIINKIGSGSYSKVKLAFSENHKAMVAIKIVSKYHVPDEFLRKFLYNEIKVVKFLKHENIIKYYQSIESSHRLYVIMQYAENGSLLDLIHKERRLPEQRACDIFRQIIAGVEYCHSQGICHRDIKCENILLDKNFVVKLIDFGFAKSYRPILNRSSREKLETTQAIPSTSSARPSSSSHHRKSDRDPMLSETYCGSYAYASPEILKGIPYDPFQSDVWAMGCVLYAMVFGRLPFDDRDPAKLIRQVQSTVNFPSSVEASEIVKTCIKRILSPLKLRYTIQSLKNDIWVNTAHLNQSPSLSSARKLPTR